MKNVYYKSYCKFAKAIGTLYYKMDGSEKHELLSILIKEINIYENKQPNGQWLKQIVFSLPIIGDEELYMSLDNENPVETVVCLYRSSLT